MGHIGTIITTNWIIFTALFSVKGLLKIITLLISSLGMLALLAITIFAICRMLFGNFGT